MQRCISNENFMDTGFYHALQFIKGKYKVQILYTLTEFRSVRYNEMKKYLGGNMSHKMMTSALKELEADGLIHRKEFKQNLPKVEYSLTKKGESLIPILDSLCEWGDSLKSEA